MFALVLALFSASVLPALLAWSGAKQDTKTYLYNTANILQTYKQSNVPKTIDALI